MRHEHDPGSTAPGGVWFVGGRLRWALAIAACLALLPAPARADRSRVVADHGVAVSADAADLEVRHKIGRRATFERRVRKVGAVVGLTIGAAALVAGTSVLHNADRGDPLGSYELERGLGCSRSNARTTAGRRRHLAHRRPTVLRRW